MNLVIKMLVAKYGKDIALWLYEEYKKEKAAHEKGGKPVEKKPWEK